MAAPKDVTYEELLVLQKNPEVVIVDVRDHSEVEETGKLPGSINIPLGDLNAAFESPEADFKSKYGVNKPQVDTPLVFSCKLGRRGQAAVEKALAKGFTNPRNFEGGFVNWEAKGKK